MKNPKEICSCLNLVQQQDDLFDIEVDNLSESIWHDQAEGPLERVLVLRYCNLQIEIMPKYAITQHERFTWFTHNRATSKGCWVFALWNEESVVQKRHPIHAKL